MNQIKKQNLPWSPYPALILEAKWRKIIIALSFFLPRIAFGWSFTDGAEAYAIIHKANNMYFFAAVGLLMASINMSVRIRSGGQMRLWLSRSIACLFFTINFVCIIFLVIHFAPEMETIFDWFFNLFGRIFG